MLLWLDPGIEFSYISSSKQQRLHFKGAAAAVTQLI